MFDHFLDIIVLIFFGYAITYPILLSLVPLKSIDIGFYRFNLGLSIIIGSIGVAAFYFSSDEYFIKIMNTIWLVLLIVFTAMKWNAEKISNRIINLISFFGIISIGFILNEFFPELNIGIVFLSVLIGSFITSAVFYSMILGHWYLNVIELPIKYLRNATFCLTAALMVRVVWDIYFISTNTITDAYGLNHSLWYFLIQFDGFLLLIAILIGTLFPLIINFFAFKTIKLQATQSATGLLYVSIVSILFGDMIFKFYLFQYGLTL